MWIDRRTDYAARAILALAIVHGDGGLVTLDQIAERTAVPRSVLEQVMPKLRSAGLVRSVRGRNGGYRLNKEPDEITLELVVRLFQGPLAPIGCATRRNPEPCEVGDGCSMRDVWTDVRDATIEALRRSDFASLARDASGVWRGPMVLSSTRTG
jgi:Rrf2 family cysteine metabolism transcriptional repressor